MHRGGVAPSGLDRDASRLLGLCGRYLNSGSPEVAGEVSKEMVGCDVLETNSYPANHSRQRGLLMGLLLLGDIDQARLDFVKAQSRYEVAIDLCHELDGGRVDQDLVDLMVFARLRVGLVALETGDFETGILPVDHALALARVVAEDKSNSSSLERLAQSCSLRSQLAQQRSEYVLARRFLEEGLEAARLRIRDGARAEAAGMLQLLILQRAYLALDEGNADEAHRNAQEAHEFAIEALSQAPEHRERLALSHLALGDLALSEQEIEIACVLYQQAKAGIPHFPTCPTVIPWGCPDARLILADREITCRRVCGCEANAGRQNWEVLLSYRQLIRTARTYHNVRALGILLSQAVDSSDARVIGNESRSSIVREMVGCFEEVSETWKTVRSREELRWAQWKAGREMS